MYNSTSRIGHLHCYLKLEKSDVVCDKSLFVSSYGYHHSHFLFQKCHLEISQSVSYQGEIHPGSLFVKVLQSYMLTKLKA